MEKKEFFSSAPQLRVSKKAMIWANCPPVIITLSISASVRLTDVSCSASELLLFINTVHQNSAQKRQNKTSYLCCSGRKVEGFTQLVAVKNTSLGFQ
jgi:hypothetical protein